MTVGCQEVKDHDTGCSGFDPAAAGVYMSVLTTNNKRREFNSQEKDIYLYITFNFGLLRTSLCSFTSAGNLKTFFFKSLDPDHFNSSIL